LLRLAGALGLIAVFLIGVEMQRAGMAVIDAAQLGLWLTVLGGVLALVAGFVPATRAMVRTNDEVVDVDRDRTAEDTVRVERDTERRVS
jgi:hypothetical protein